MKYSDKKKKGTYKDKKKKNVRGETEFPALLAHLNLKIRANEIDYDYIHKLSDEEKRFLNDFTEGSVNASRKGGVFTTPAEWKKNEDKNNARNRCILSREEAKNNLQYFSQLLKSPASIDKWDTIIEKLDNESEKKKKN